MNEYDDLPPAEGEATQGASAREPRKRRRPEPSPKQRALGLLVRREHSRQELTRKLLARGVSRDEAAEAVGHMSSQGWQDDARFAEMLVRSRVGQGYGPLRIRAELKMHGLEADLVQASLDSWAGQWKELARRLVERRHGEEGPGDWEARRKAAEMLARRGFDRDSISAATQFDDD